MNKNDLHSILKDILKEFIYVCDKLNLKYFAIGGTLLGTIRHNGFIPWDDDIDIGMLREDYNKFLEEAPKYLKTKYFLQTYKSDAKYPYIFAKLRNTETTFIESVVKDIDINHGVYIDIFPFDKISNNQIIQRYNMIYFKVLREKLYKNLYFGPQNNRGIKGKILSMVSKIILKNKNKYEIIELINKNLIKYENKDVEYIWNSNGAWGSREIVKIDYFNNFEKRMFEDIEIIIPKKYDLYLKEIYGNYLELPTKEKRKSHHKCEHIDLNKSYIYYK